MPPEFKSTLLELLRLSDAVVLERIARGAGQVNWFYCRDAADLEAVEARLRPGSVVSFYFDGRIRREANSAQAKLNIRKFVLETGEAIVGTVVKDGPRMNVEIVSGPAEIDEALEALGLGSPIFYGVFPSRDNDGVRAVTFNLPDHDGSFRVHPH